MCGTGSNFGPISQVAKVWKLKAVNSSSDLANSAKIFQFMNMQTSIKRRAALNFTFLNINIGTLKLRSKPLKNGKCQVFHKIYDEVWMKAKN